MIQVAAAFGIAAETTHAKESNAGHDAAPWDASHGAVMRCCRYASLTLVP